MQTLVEDVMALEREAESILTQARNEAKEIEKRAQAEAEAYRRSQAEATERKVAAFHREAEERHQNAIAEAKKDLVRALEALERIPDGVLKEQIDRIVARFREG